ncbi:MAG TPA: YqeG family HAD IIIA-type phosphatase [bacterium]|nr:YqeG family HAD IIIA-type phosphatase [bacterium]
MAIRWVTPDRAVPAVTDVDIDELAASGISGVILDLDNTIVAWDAAAPSPGVAAWVERLLAAGLKGCIVSNNLTGRARAIATALGVFVVIGAIKPAPWALRRAMRLMETSPQTTALIGDQLFTDVLGGNLVGMQTILVEPLSRAEFPTTKIVRALERTIRAKVLRGIAESRNRGNQDGPSS